MPRRRLMRAPARHACVAQTLEPLQSRLRLGRTPGHQKGRKLEGEGADAPLREQVRRAAQDERVEALRVDFKVADAVRRREQRVELTDWHLNHTLRFARRQALWSIVLYEQVLRRAEGIAAAADKGAAARPGRRHQLELGNSRPI